MRTISPTQFNQPQKDGEHAHQKDPCLNAFYRARCFLKQGQWRQAASGYSLALKEFDNLPATNKHRLVNRYLRIALEFSFALRMSDYRADLPALVAIVRNYIASHFSVQSIDDVMRPLEDIAFAPKEQAQYWMGVLFALEESEQSVKQ